MDANAAPPSISCMVNNPRCFDVLWRALACCDVQDRCADNCPTDPLKTEPGLCGCNIADTGAQHDANLASSCSHTHWKKLAYDTAFVDLHSQYVSDIVTHALQSQLLPTAQMI